MLRRGGIQSFRTIKLDYYECTIGINHIYSFGPNFDIVIRE